MEDHGQGEALLKVAPPPLPPGQVASPQAGRGDSSWWGRKEGHLVWPRCLCFQAPEHRETWPLGRGGGSPAPAPGSLQAPLLKACSQLPLTEALPSQQRQRARRRARWSPSSGSSSDSSWEGSEPEEAPKDVPEEAPAGGPEPPPAQYAVPDMDLWVPARQSTEELGGAVAGGCPRPPEGPDTAQAPTPAPAGQLASRSRSADLRSVGCPCPAAAHRWSSKGPLGKVGPGGSTPLPGGCQGCAQRRQRPRCGAEASPLRIMAPIPGPFPESCPGQQLAP